MEFNSRSNEIMMFQDTEKICKQGYYEFNGVKIPLKFPKDKLEVAAVFSVDDVNEIKLGSYSGEDITLVPLSNNRCKFECKNIDTFAYVQDLINRGKKDVVALNLASPVNPGGGVRKGSRAQEEDLCRKSTLLMSLESLGASDYYDYNRSLNTFNGSDAMVYSPYVEVIKDSRGSKMRNTFTCSIITCAAPKVNRGYNGLSKAQYIELFRNRIFGMLDVLAYLGHRNIVLGAWGCGAYGNDAKIVSNVFYEVLNDFKYMGYTIDDLFESINFGVLDMTQDKYNFKEFYRNFRERL